jgi:hypothetical protein
MESDSHAATGQHPQSQIPITLPMKNAPQKSKIKVILLTFLVLVSLIIIGGGSYYLATNKVHVSKSCTMEAKLCPDGSYVGRSGPNCEFTVCPKKKILTPTPEPANGQIDSHGCLIDKGYIWCESKKQCLKTWEGCSVQEISPTAGLSNNSKWKTYTNTAYGFKLQYPKYGNIQDPGCFQANSECGPTHIGECGNAIKDKKTGTSIYIGIDNFFGIFPETWSNSISDYIKMYDPQGIRNYTFINIPSADEAVKIDSKLNKEVEGYAPLAYHEYIFKKSNLLISIQGFQNPGEEYGCVGPIANYNWDIPPSFSFTQ